MADTKSIVNDIIQSELNRYTDDDSCAKMIARLKQSYFHRPSSRYTVCFPNDVRYELHSLVSEILDERMKDLVSHVTTAPNSLGEAWLDSKIGNIERWISL